METEPTAEQKARAMIDELMAEHAQGGVYQSPPHVIYTLVARLLSRAERAERERENWKSTAEEAHYRMVLARRALSVGVDVNPSDVARIDTITRNSAGGGE